MEKSDKIILFGLGLAVLIFVILALGARNKNATNKNILIINGEKIKVEIADSPSERKKGLSNRESLAANTGMLFLFKKKDDYSFHMKDMKFPIDLVFIRGNEVIGIIKNLRVPDGDGYIANYLPPAEFDKALEINAGEAEKLGIKRGTIIKDIDKF